MSGLTRKVRRNRSFLASKSFDAGANAGLQAGREFACGVLRELANHARERGKDVSPEEIERLIEQVKQLKM